MKIAAAFILCAVLSFALVVLRDLQSAWDEPLYDADPDLPLLRRGLDRLAADLRSP